MKKLFLIFALILMSFAGNTAAFAADTTEIDVLPTMNYQSSSPNQLWVGTFQLVWNETIDKIVKKPIKFVKYKSQMATELNKKAFKTSDISDNSYYIKYGVVSPKLKEEIENGIKEKFNETSDILNLFDWAYKADKLFIYAMLKKDFKFLTPFDKLSSAQFGTNPNEVEYFGIDENSSKALAKNVHVLFYNSDNDFAVKLYTKDKDEVILYRTDEDMTFDNYYTQISKKEKKYTGSDKFHREDILRIPNINLYQQTSFAELEGHKIKGSKFIIDKTIETIDFKMDNEGVKLKSEAAIMMKCMSLAPNDGRYFVFNDKFVLFLVEKGKDTPYFAMKASDIEALNKTAKN
jgi:hypothetical protein